MSRQGKVNIASVVVVILVMFFITRPRLPGPNELARALIRAEAAFSSIQVRGDVAFWVTQGARIADRDVELTLHREVRRNRYSRINRVDLTYWKLRDENLPRVDRLDIEAEEDINPLKLADPADMSSPERTKRVIKIIADSAECRPGRPVTALMSKPGYGYVSTHQLLGLIIAVEKGCMKKSAFTENARPFIRRIYTEMLKYEGQLTDLQVERAALLGLVGQAELIPKRLVNRVLKAQKKDGLWYYGDSDNPSLNVASHNAALSYALLATILAEVTGG